MAAIGGDEQRIALRLHAHQDVFVGIDRAIAVRGVYRAVLVVVRPHDHAVRRRIGEGGRRAGNR